MEGTQEGAASQPQKFDKHRVHNPLLFEEDGTKFKSILPNVDQAVAHAQEFLKEYDELFRTNKVSASLAQGILRKGQQFLEEEYKKRTDLRQKFLKARQATSEKASEDQEAKKEEGAATGGEAAGEGEGQAKQKEGISPYFAEHSGVDETSKEIAATERELSHPHSHPGEEEVGKEGSGDGKEVKEKEKEKEPAQELGEGYGKEVSVNDDAEDMRLKALLEEFYKREGILLRQLAKAEQDVRNRFLLFHESSLRFDRALQWAVGNPIEDVEVLNASAQNMSTIASMMKESPEQTEMFERAYSFFERATALPATEEEVKKVQLMALWNWASALEEHAERRKGEDADAIFEKAVQKYDEYLFKIAPDPAPEVLFGKAVVLHSQARNREETLNKNSKRIDELYGKAAELYKDIWERECDSKNKDNNKDNNKGKEKGKGKAKKEEREDEPSTGVDNFMIGVLVNLSMTVLNQARFRTLNHMLFQPFPDVCISILRECREILSRFIEENEFLPTQEKPKEMLQKQLEEVTQFENILRFKDRMEEIQQNLRAGHMAK